MRATVTCRACGRAMLASMRRCPSCGTPRGAVIVRRSPDRRTPRGPGVTRLELARLHDRLTRLEGQLFILLTERSVPSSADTVAPAAVTEPQVVGFVEPELPAESSGPIAVGSVDDVVLPDLLAAKPVFPAPPAKVPAPRVSWHAPDVQAVHPGTQGRRTLADLDALVSGQGLALVGGLAVLIGAVFFMSLAFDRGWIGPGPRVVIGVVASLALILAGGRLFTREDSALAHVLVAVGLGIMSLSMIAATRLYDLIPIEVGLLGCLLSALPAAAIAIRFDLQVVAGYGIVATLAAPLLLGAEPTGATIAFLAVTLAASAWIALYRTWAWLPVLSFLLSVVQFVDWVTGDQTVAEPPPRLLALAALGAFWLLYAIAAGGVELRERRDQPTAPALGLLLADAAFAVVAGLAILDDGATGWRGAFLFATAAAHAALGAVFLRVRGPRHWFGTASIAIAAAFLVAAIAVQVDGAATAIAWAAVAVGLVAVGRRVPNDVFPLAAGAAGLLAVLHLVTFEYVPGDLIWVEHDGVPFASGAGLTLVALLLAGAISATLLGDPRVSRWVVAIGAGLVAYALPFELTGPALVAGWAAVAVAAAAAHRWGALSPRSPASGLPTLGSQLDVFGREAALGVATAAPIVLGIGHLLAWDFPLERVASGGSSDEPFAGAGLLALACLLAGMAGVAAVARDRSVRRLLAVAATAAVAYALPFELSGAWLVAAWSALAWVVARGCVWAPLHDEHDGESAPLRWEFAAAALATWALAGLHVVFQTYPLDRIARDRQPDGGFADARGLALLLALAALALLALLRPRIAPPRGAAGVGLALVAYALPFAASGTWLVVGWAAVAFAAAVADRLVPPAPFERSGLDAAPVGSATAPVLVAAIASGLVVAHLLTTELNPADLSDRRLPATPFADQRTLAVVAAAWALVLAAEVTPSRLMRHGWRLGVLAAAAYLVPFELGAAGMATAWAVLALAAVFLADAGALVPPVGVGAAFALGAAAAATAFGVVAPPSRLVVDARDRVDHPFLLNGATLALAALALAMEGGRRRVRTARGAQALAIGSGAAVVYLLSVAVADHFQRQVGTTVDLAALQKRAQVALSILWAVLGGGAFVLGVARARPPVRLFGLGLLGVATAKVFVWDLSTLSTSYRVLSFVGLGVLLLLSSYVYQHLVGAGVGQRRFPRGQEDPLRP